MILSFRHKGLARLYTRKKDTTVDVPNPWFMAKGERVLARLDIAREPMHMDLPGWSLQPLNGQMEGLWSVVLSGNWRIVFRFKGDRQGKDTDKDSDVVDVDLVDCFKPGRRLQVCP
jgi:proteic killer suppression protein